MIPMKKKSYLLLVLIFYFLCPAFTNAQGWLNRILSKNKTVETYNLLSDTFTFTTIRNDPDGRPNLTLLLNPAYLEFYGLNINMGAEASIHYSIHNKINFWGLYKQAYIELVNKYTVDQNNSYGGPATGPTTLKNGEVGVEYNFKSVTDPYDESIFMGRYLEHAINRSITANYLDNYGLRISAQYFETYFSGDQIPLSGYYINDPSKKIFSLGNGTLGTVMQENIIGIGTSRTGIHDLLVSNSSLGKRETQYKTYLYGDILFAPAISYTNVIMKNYGDLSRQQFTGFNVNSATTKSRIGFRAGFTFNDLSKVGFTFSLETGVRPGPDFVSGLYFMGKFGIALNGKI